MTQLYNQITIIGLGLIGASLAMNIKRQGLAAHLCGVESSPQARAELTKMDIVDCLVEDLALGVKEADLVILAIPVGAMESVAEQIAPHLKAGAVVSDVGSTKGNVMQALQGHLPEQIIVIGGHPLAGTENSGPQAAFEQLFQGRWTVLVPSNNAPQEAIDQLAALWQACGSMIEVMSAEYHDKVLAITSHLPHLIAYCIVHTAMGLEKSDQEEVIKFSASGFRDFTRIAGSNPTMWRDIFLGNKEAVLEMLQRFSEDLTALQRNIRCGKEREKRIAFAVTNIALQCG